jgi:hypothetical protein
MEPELGRWPQTLRFHISETLLDGARNSHEDVAIH